MIAMTVIACIAGTILGCVLLYAVYWLISKVVRLIMGVFVFSLFGLLILNGVQALIHTVPEVVSGMLADIDAAVMIDQAQELLRSVAGVLF